MITPHFPGHLSVVEPAIVTWMKHELALGIAEDPGGPANDGAPRTRYCNGETKPKSKDGWEWCAAMVRKGFEATGSPLPHNPRFSYNRGQRELWSALEMFQQLKRVKATVRLHDAQAGDIIFFARGSKLVGHVGVIVAPVEWKEDPSVLMVHTIEGNVEDAVRARVHMFTPTKLEAMDVADSSAWTPHALVCRWPARP